MERALNLQMMTEPIKELVRAIWNVIKRIDQAPKRLIALGNKARLMEERMNMLTREQIPARYVQRTLALLDVQLRNISRLMITTNSGNFKQWRKSAYIAKQLLSYNDELDELQGRLNSNLADYYNTELQQQQKSQTQPGTVPVVPDLPHSTPQQPEPQPAPVSSCTCTTVPAPAIPRPITRTKPFSRRPAFQHGFFGELVCVAGCYALTQDSTTTANISVRAISAYWDHTLKVWDLNTDKELCTLKGSGVVSCCAVTPDGTRAVSGGWDSTLKVWDLNTHKQLYTLQGHSDSVYCCAVTPDGTRALSGSHDKTMKVWDLTTQQELYTFDLHGGNIYCCAISPDGKRIIICSGDRTLRVWDLDTHEELCTLKGHSGCAFCCAFTPDGTRAISGSDDHTLKVWDLETQQELHTLKGHTWRVNCCAVTSDGTRAISGSWDQTFKVWDLNTGQEL